MTTLIISIITLICTFLHYRKPLKYQKEPVANSQENRCICASFSEISIFNQYPIFTFSEEFKKCFKDNSNDNGTYKTYIYNQGLKINKTCIILEGSVNVFYQDNLVAIKKAGSLIYVTDFFRETTRIANNDVKVFVFDSQINSYMFYLMIKKQHMNIFCNFLYQIDKLCSFEIENFVILDYEFQNGIQNLQKSLIQHETEIEIFFNLKTISKNLIENLKKTFVNEFCKIFNVQKKKFIYENIEIKFFKKYETVKEVNTDLDYIFIVIKGKMQIKYDKCEYNHCIKEGNIFGYFNSYFGVSRGYLLESHEDTLIMCVQKDVQIRSGFKQHIFDYNMLPKISELFNFIDSSSEWIRLQPGDELKNKEHEFEHLFVVDHGKLTIKYDNLPISKKSKDLILSGSLIGGFECITDQKFETSFVALKISDLIRIDNKFIKYFMKVNPEFTINFSKRILQNEKPKICKVVSIIPSDEHYKLFYSRFSEVLPDGVLFVTNKKINEILGANAFDSLGEFKLLNYLSEKERVHDLIVIPLENRFSRLFNSVISFSDILLMIGRCELGVDVFCSVELVNIYKTRFYNQSHYKDSNTEKENFRQKNRKRLYNFNKKLINNVGKLNSEKFIKGNTLKCEKSSKTNIDDFKDANRQIFIKYDKIHHVSLSYDNFCMKDFERLGRSLLDKKIGLVLGGGGARGLAHIGIIQALEESGISIDVIGGTSMGAYIGALYARKCDNISVFKEVKNFCLKMATKWRLLLDLTYPFCSLFTGYAFNRLIFQSFTDTKIEDLWIEYFCITTNITTFEEMVHRKGILWRYVRASMSLAGYLPPICDFDGKNVNLLLDGGYLNNVPANTMLDLGVNKVIAVDVGSSTINDHFNYGDSLNGFSAIFQRFFSSKKFISLDEIQYRLAYVSSENKMRELVHKDIILLRPEIDEYKTMEFDKFEEIVACGYSYGKKIVQEWKKNGVFKELAGINARLRRRYSI
ncbi:phosphatidylcholine and lysophosphatidylcholine phospholipase [Conglomerata obtusa]